jgi:DNA-binding NarL/FixJ family response regulator
MEPAIAFTFRSIRFLESGLSGTIRREVFTVAPGNITGINLPILPDSAGINNLRTSNCGIQNAHLCPENTAPMIRRDGQRPVEGHNAVAPSEGAPAEGAPASTISSTAIRVALLSESALFRSSLRRLLSDRSFLVVGEITAPPIRGQLRSSVPQILLVDAQIAGVLEVCRELRLNGVRPWVILAGADGHERWAVEALKTGVRGILPKSATFENLLKAIRVVHQGEVWASNRVIALTVEELAARSVNCHVGKLTFRERLSRREQEIVHLIVDGLSNLEAGIRLGITEATVKAHLTHIFQKLALRSRAQLAARYHVGVPAPSRGAGGAPRGTER